MYNFYNRLRHTSTGNHSTTTKTDDTSSSASSSNALIVVKGGGDASDKDSDSDNDHGNTHTHGMIDNNNVDNSIGDPNTADESFDAEEGNNNHNPSLILDRSIRVVVMVHTMKWNYQTRIVAIQKTWLGRLPYWAKLEFYTTTNDRSVSLPEFNTILVDTKEDTNVGNDQFFVALKEVVDKYTQCNAFLRVDDHTYINWQGLLMLLDNDPMLQPIREEPSSSSSSSTDKSNIGDGDSYSRDDGMITTNTNHTSTNNIIITNIYINNTFRYLGNCNCIIKHDKKGIYCANSDNKKDCTVLDHIPDFNYVCGGSGVLMNRWVDRCLDG